MVKEVQKKDNSTKDKQPKQPKQPNNQPDEQQLKIISAVGYLGILFFLPYVMFPKDKFAIFHANQGLILLLFGIAGQVLAAVLAMVTFGIGFIFSPLFGLATFGLFVVGIINAMNGHMKRLPVIGNFDLLKFDGGK